MTLLGSAKGQVGQGPGLVEHVPAHGKGLEVDELEGPFQSKPFYGSVIPAHGD